MIDVHVNLSRWPFRRLAGDEPGQLPGILRRKGVTEAWACSFDALLHKDITGVNERLAKECASSGGFLVPFGSINPRLPDWQEDLRRLHDVHRMAGIRLHPGYHGYKLQDPVTSEVLAAAANRNLPVQIVLVMEDERTQHPLLRVPPVDPAPLADLLRRVPALRVMLLNSGNTTAPSVNTYYDFAMREGPYAITRLLPAAPDRVVFGSYSPFFYFDSAALKLREASLSPEQMEAITRRNALTFLGRRSR